MEKLRSPCLGPLQGWPLLRLRLCTLELRGKSGRRGRCWRGRTNACSSGGRHRNRRRSLRPDTRQICKGYACNSRSMSPNHRPNLLWRRIHCLWCTCRRPWACTRSRAAKPRATPRLRYHFACVSRWAHGAALGVGASAWTRGAAGLAASLHGSLYDASRTPRAHSGCTLAWAENAAE